MKLKNRIEALSESPLFAEFIISLQKAKYDLEIDSAQKRERQDFAGQVLLRARLPENLEYEERLIIGFKRFMELNKWDRLTFILDRPTPWLEQENSFPKAKSAYEYFLQIGVERDFSGAVEINLQDVDQFFPHLFWLTRSNMALPTCYFIATESEAVGTICQYGILHFEMYSETEKASILTKAIEAGLEDFTEIQCYDQIDSIGRIEGRQMNI